MAVTEKVWNHAETLTEPGEQLQFLDVAQLKPGGHGKRAVADVAVSTAVSALSGMAMMRVSAPAPVYVAVTDQRISVFLKQGGRKPLGKLVASFPRWAVSLVEKPGGLLRTVHFDERATGHTLFRLNCGVSRSRSAAIVAAAA